METITKQKLIESWIFDFIKKDNGCHTNFEYNKSNGSLQSIRVTTFNPKKNETFLLLEITCTDEEEGLKSIFDWVKNHSLSKEEFSHTILWTKKGESGGHYKSYFYATNARKALDKFFYDKNENDYVIYEVKINPIA